MKHKKIIVAIAAVVLAMASAYGLYSAGVNHGSKMASAVPNAAASSPPSAQNAVNGKKVLYWHDPMVPGQRFDKPGKSPFMDMQLVPVYADDAAGNAADDGMVNINPRVQQNLGIRTAEVAKGNLTSAVEAVGSVAYNERDVALVQARSNGFVERLLVRAPLDPVRKGQALAELYVPDWVAAQEEYLSVRRMQGNGVSGLLDGARQRMRLAGMTDDQLRLVETTGKVQPRLTIFAPIGGVVSELSAREGMTVMAGAPLFRINGLRTIWVNADVPENLAAQLRPGIAVEARTPSLPGTSFKGRVSAILPEVNPATRTLKARVELANPSGQLVPGMFATISFTSIARKDVLLVPTEAVIQTGTRSVVMLAQGDGKFIPIEVEIGTETNGQSEIRKGLAAGQKVVVSGQFLIDSEASLKGTATRMSDMPAQHGQNRPNGDEAAGPTHHGQGKVESIDKDQITISHGPIPTLQWGPMTMAFKLPASGPPKDIAVGDSVVFEIQAAKDGAFTITTIAPTAAVPMSDRKDKAMDRAMKTPAEPSGAGK
ncbi:efflux RND transporter periplasmic adaptor subunit [Undibacterium arcticum]|uniref:Efflux RND transporter periplasmic adaptor subunit n=1 Tax=Undibacterium arcticum TaxID=1762892 RepID=A0ABV7F008_9BURK